MGSPDSDKDDKPAEKPQHRVRITKPFWLGMHLVTVGQFRKFAEESKYYCGHGLAERVSVADRRLPGGQRELGRCQGVLRLAHQEGRQEVPFAHGGGVGVRLPGGHTDQV